MGRARCFESGVGPVPSQPGAAPAIICYFAATVGSIKTRRPDLSPSSVAKIFPFVDLHYGPVNPHLPESFYSIRDSSA